MICCKCFKWIVVITSYLHKRLCFNRMKEEAIKQKNKVGRNRFNDLFTLFIRKDQVYHNWCKETSMTWSIFHTLDSLLRENASRTPSEIADELNIPRQTMTSVLDNLQNMGLIERKTHCNDRRKKIIVLSDRGKEYAVDLFRQLHDAELRAYNALSVEEQVTFNQLFNKWVTALETELK